MRANGRAEPIDYPQEITSAWLSRALAGEVYSVSTTRVGTGQIGSCYRCVLAGSGVPARVLVKLPTADPGTRSMLVGAYRCEVNFYRELADTVAADVPLCYFGTDVDENGRYSLILEDLAPATQGDQLAGCSPAQAHEAAVNLAGLHGPRWCDPSLVDTGWLNLNGMQEAEMMAEVYAPAVEQFLADVGHLLSATTVDIVRATVGVVSDWSLARSARFAPVHGDYRLDNLMFHPDGSEPVKAVDWQTLSLGLPARDLAYLLGTGLSVADRRAHERTVVTAYHKALVAHGVAGYHLDDCWDDYCFAMVQGALVSVFGCAYGARSERGDRMFAVMVERSCAAMDDLGTLEMTGLPSHRP